MEEVTQEGNSHPFPESRRSRRTSLLWAASQATDAKTDLKSKPTDKKKKREEVTSYLIPILAASRR